MVREGLTATGLVMTQAWGELEAAVGTFRTISPCYRYNRQFRYEERDDYGHVKGR